MPTIDPIGQVTAYPELLLDGIGKLACLALLLSVCSAASGEDKDAPETGYFKVELSPLELLGEKGALEVSPIFRPDDDTSWQLYVPPDYDASRPAGAVVWVSPTPRGGPPRSWNKILQKKNLIWIGANGAGNRVAVAKRMILAMLAPRVLVRDYALNADRIYIAGFSGGGKTAGLLSHSSPDIFRGGLYIGGAEAWKPVTPPPRLDLIRRNRHVFLTGTKDFNERLTRRVYSTYKSAGVENCELIVVNRMGHELPRAGVFLRALDYLDSRNAGEFQDGLVGTIPYSDSESGGG